MGLPIFSEESVFFRKRRLGPWRDLAKEDERIIQYLLKSRSIVIRNLKSLGYSVPVLESTFVSRNLLLNRNRKMELMEPAFFVSDQLEQLDRMRARRIEHYISWRLKQKSERSTSVESSTSRNNFDQILTNDLKSRSTKPTKSTFQRNPPCAREIN